MKIKASTSKITIGIILFIMTYVSSNFNWGKEHWKSVVVADAKGYYAYLPAVFIYDDLNFGFFDSIENKKYYNPNLYYDYRSGSNNKVINKYYCGTAVAELPFFLIAHGMSHLVGNEMDGYSKLYPIFVNISALFYLFIGLVYLNSTLKTFQLNEKQRSITLVAAVFGTNLFYYTAVEPGASHIFSFGFISMFLFYARNFFLLFQKKHIVILALLLGIIVLIRPINGLVIFILPFLAGDLHHLKVGLSNLFRHKVLLVISLILAFLIISIQLIIYKISFGSFIVYSYGEEGFNFTSPQFFNILFSYRKGLFLYTPILLLSCTGLYFLWKLARFQFYMWLGFFVLITYVFSSWWMWYYGGSFSSRVYVEFIPLFMILFALALKNIQRLVFKRLYLGLVILLIVVCQIQTYQYRHYQIHWSDMNKEKYWNVFLRIDKII